MKPVRLLVFAACLLGSSTAGAENLCALDYSKLDSLHVKEQELTREKFDEALKTLGKIDSKDYASFNEINFGIILYNALKIVEGYALKTKAQNETNSANYGRSMFCSWLEKTQWSD